MKSKHAEMDFELKPASGLVGDLETQKQLRFLIILWSSMTNLAVNGLFISLQKFL